MLTEDKKYKSKTKEELIASLEELNEELSRVKGGGFHADWFNTTTELIYIIDFNGVIVDVNKAVEAKYGYKKSELIGKTGEILSAPGMNNLDEVGKKFQQVIEHGKEIKYDWWSRKKNGEIFPKEFIIRRVFDSNGVGKVIMSGRDISERIEFEEKLIRSERQYKSLFERNLAGIYRTTIDGEIVDCNPAFASILGYRSKKELIGKINAEDFYEEKGGRLKSIDRILQKKSITSNRIRLLKKDGTPISVLTSTSAITNPDTHEVEFMEGTLIDITQLVRTEEMLNKSQESYRSLLDSSPFGVILHDQGRVVFANRKAKDLMGTLEVGKKWKNKKEFTVFDFIFDVDHTAAKERIKRAYEGEDLPFKEYQLKRADGKKINVETKTKLIDFRGKKVLLISFHDVTRIKQLEKEKLRTQLVQEVNERLTRELEEKTQIQNKLIASEEKLKTSLMEKEVLLKEVHHRVKNNLQVISSIFNLQKNYSENQTVKDILIESQNRIKSMAFIHESLYKTVDFARINFTEYAETLCQNLLKSYNSYGKTPDLEMKIQEVFLNLDFAIPCGLILNELITNAIKYAFEGKDHGVITVKISQQNKKVSMMIKDDGVGLPGDVDFEDSSSLGFQLVNALVSQLNGNIKLTVKDGTKFDISFNTK